jgi:hypothetical protein
MAVTVLCLAAAPLLRGAEGAGAKVAEAETVVVIGEPDLDPKSEVNKQGKKVILEAIYRMVGSHDLATNKLYNTVTRARSFGLVAKVPFRAGRTQMTAGDKDALKTTMKTAGLQRFFNDPTLVIVALGFADNPGDSEANATVAKQRAQSMNDLMRKDCDIRLVMHPLAVRDWLLSDPSVRTRDYAGEVWVILP